MEAAVLVGGDDSELDVDGLAVEHGVDLLINPAHQLLVQIPEVHHEQRTDDGGGGGEAPASNGIVCFCLCPA